MELTPLSDVYLQGIKQTKEDVEEAVIVEDVIIKEEKGEKEEKQEKEDEKEYPTIIHSVTVRQSGVPTSDVGQFDVSSYSSSSEIDQEYESNKQPGRIMETNADAEEQRYRYHYPDDEEADQELTRLLGEESEEQSCLSSASNGINKNHPNVSENKLYGNYCLEERNEDCRNPDYNQRERFNNSSGINNNPHNNCENNKRVQEDDADQELGRFLAQEREERSVNRYEMNRPENASFHYNHPNHFENSIYRNYRFEDNRYDERNEDFHPYHTQRQESIHHFRQCQRTVISETDSEENEGAQGLARLMAGSTEESSSD